MLVVLIFDICTCFTYICIRNFTYMEISNTLMAVTTMGNETNPAELTAEQRKQRIKEIKQRIYEKQFRNSSKPLYDNAVDLQIMIDDYYENGIETAKVIVGAGSNTKEIEIKKPTLSGLVLHLGYENRNSFYDQERVPHLSGTIKRARERISQHYENHLMSGYSVGAIFALKNMGWIDKTEQTINQTIKEVKVNVTTSELTPKIDNI